MKSFDVSSTCMPESYFRGEEVDFETSSIKSFPIKPELDFDLTWSSLPLGSESDFCLKGEESSIYSLEILQFLNFVRQPQNGGEILLLSD
jgi:hypothetical protein